MDRSQAVAPQRGAARFICRTIPLASLDDPGKVALLERIERYARARDPRVTQVMASLAGEYDVVLVARTDGVIAADVRPLVRLSVQVIAEQDGRREQGSAAAAGASTTPTSPTRCCRDYADKAVRPGAHQSRRATGAGRRR